ncbi:MAG TPA: D-arabinono-1,4-lactone oxidase [Acidimicrobiia bacterium]|jgi:L-gulonolactone oxidase
MPESAGWQNWARNQRCSPAAREEPRSVLEVVEAIRRARSAGQKVKVAGSGHSFTDAACTDGRLLSVDHLDRVVDVDRDRGTITVEAGITIRALNRELAERGLALANLGDIDRQTIAGATSTGTHGTGARLGGLATFIQGMELVTADGDVLRCSRDEEPEAFHCARVGIGALGVVTRVTLACEPAYTLRHVERAGRFDEVVGELDELVDGHDHFELYWLPHTDTCSLLCNDRTEDAPRPKSAYKRWRAEVFYPNYFFGALVTAGRLHPPLVPRIAQLVAGTVGSARLVDRSDRILISTRLLRFVEMEYAIPREHAPEAMRAVRRLIDDEDLRVSFPVEVRFTAPDDIPLSTAHGRETCYIAVHMARGMPHEPYFDGVERIMDRFGGRPHWGKLHGQDAATLAPRYPEWDRFARARARLDPEGRFRNVYLDRVLGTVPAAATSPHK